MQTEFAVRKVVDGILVEIRGPLGKEGGEALLRVVQDQGAVPRHLVLNMTGVGVINTAGIGGVLWAVRLVAKAGGRASAYGLSDHFRKIFHVMGLTQYLFVAADEEAALGGTAR